MAKYDPLHTWLRRQKVAELQLTFVEIERIVGRMLPKSALRSQWWSVHTDDVAPQVQSRAWRDAGYEAFLHVGEDRVLFRRPRQMP